MFTIFLPNICLFGHIIPHHGLKVNSYADDTQTCRLHSVHSLVLLLVGSLSPDVLKSSNSQVVKTMHLMVAPELRGSRVGDIKVHVLNNPGKTKNETI